MFKKLTHIVALMGITFCIVMSFADVNSAHAANKKTDTVVTEKVKDKTTLPHSGPPKSEVLTKSGAMTNNSATVPPLNTENLKNNVYTMVLNALKQQGLPMTPAMNEFTADKIVIGKAIPFSAGDMHFYLVSLAIKAPAAIGGNVVDPETDMEKTLVLTVDPSGTYHFQDVNEIISNKSMTLEAKRIVQKTTLPNNFGELLFTGPGTEEVIFISDVFCPFCRDAFEYLMTKKEQIKTFKIVHSPIKELHPSAEIVSLLMAYAHDLFSQEEYSKFVNYAYTSLNEDRSIPANEMELTIVKKLREAFPEFAKKNADPEAMLYFLKGKYAPMIEANRTISRSLGIQGTPAMYVNGFLVKGFDLNTLNTIFK